MIRLVLNSLVFQQLPLDCPGDEYHETKLATKFLRVAGGSRRIAYRVAEAAVNDGTVMIYFHGNCETIYDLGEKMQKLADTMGNTVIYYDYPGYGLSEGRSTEEITKSDALEVFQFVKKQYTRNNDASRIVLVGRSLGSAPAVYTASVYSNIRALVLISPFRSVIHTKFKSNIFNSLDMFKNEAYMPYIKAPCLFFHGLEDQVIPAEHSRKLYELSTSPHSELYLVREVGHDSILHRKKWQVLLKHIYSFLLKGRK